jgi:microcystin degradation protein MlrC
MLGQTRYQVTARSDGAEAKLKVTAVCEYGDRSVSVDAEITDEKLLSQIANAAKQAIKDKRDELGTQAQLHAAEAMVVAAKKGEKI